jgi:hypothetical protein
MKMVSFILKRRKSKKKKDYKLSFLIERQVLREKLSDLLGEKIRQIIEMMDKPDYTPKLNNYSELDSIYESDFKDIQPYLFRVNLLIKLFASN